MPLPRQISLRKKRRQYPGEPAGLPAKIVWHFHRKRKKLITKAIYRIRIKGDTLDELSKFDRFQLKWLGKFLQDSTYLPLATYAKIAHSVMTLAPTARLVTQPPRLPQAPAQPIEKEHPALQAYVFIKAEVAANSSAIVVGNRIGVPQFYVSRPTAVITEPHKLLWQSQDGLGMIKRSSQTQQAEGIMLFASGSANWYHWLIESLPAAYFSLNLPNGLNKLPLVISSDIAELPTFRDSLELFRNNREVLILDSGDHLFSRLVAVDSLVEEPFNMRPGHWPKASDYSFHLPAMRQYRAAILESLGITAPTQSKRIFLARGHSRRSYNQSELLEIAERYGFSAVYPERLTFREQVELLASASHVVGPSGAAFANSLFCQSGTRLVSWLPPEYKNFSSYMNIANATESQLRYLFCKPDQPICSSFDAFVATYQVDAMDFEQAIRSALYASEY